jgi:hypothetical protein
MTFEKTIYLIHKFNRNWKHAQDLWGANHATSKLLRDRKNDLQLFLLMHYPKQLITHIETDVDNEPIVAISVREPFVYQNITFNDAAHIPQRLTQDIITHKEQQ